MSRSNVIGRLASQRAVSGNGDGPSCARLAPRASNDINGRTRSSLGVMVKRGLELVVGKGS